jgi:RNA polymerase sigma-70 factor, ECF subfamily
VSVNGDDDRLASEARTGDPQSIATLYRRHAPVLLRYLVRFTGDRRDAEDILQDSFLRLLEGRGNYDGRGHFRAWLFTIATRIATDRGRQRRRRNELLRLHLASPLGIEEFVAPQTTNDFRVQVVAALATLPPEYTQAFHLRVVEGFAYRDMAKICACSEGTLRSRVHHALRRLRQMLSEQDGAPTTPIGPAERRGKGHQNRDSDTS